MDAGLIVFLEWFFGVRRIDVDDITVVLNEQNFGDVSVADVQDAMTLLAENLDEPSRSMVSRVQAQLAETTTTPSTMTIADVVPAVAGDASSEPILPIGVTLGQIAAPPDGAGSVASPIPMEASMAGADSASQSPTLSVPAAPADGSGPPPTQAQPGGSGAQPGYPPSDAVQPPPASGHDDPPANGHADPNPPPGYDHADPPANGGMYPPDNGDADQNGGPVPHENGAPDRWARNDVLTDEAGPYVEVDGVRLRLQSDGDGGYFAEHVGYRLLESPTNAQLIWHNALDEQNYSVTFVRADEFGFGTPAGDELAIHDDGFTFRLTGSSPGTSYSFDDGYGFGGFISYPDRTIRVVNLEDGYTFVLDPATGFYLEPDDGQRYDSVDDLDAAWETTEGEPPDQAEMDENGADVENGAGDAWAGNEILTDDAGPYVEVDGVRLDLESDGTGGYVASHQGRSLIETVDGALAVRLPNEQLELVDHLTDTQIFVAHPAGGELIFAETNFVFRYPNSSGNIDSYAIGTPFEFYSITDAGVQVSHPDGYILDLGPNEFFYVDPVSGESFATLAELEAAREANGAPPESEDDDPADETGIEDTPDTSEGLQSWGGHDVQADNDGLYVDLDGVRLDLIAADGGYVANHLGYTLHPEGDALTVLAGVTGEQYVVTTVEEDGIWFEHPTGDYAVGLEESGFRYRVLSDGGSSTFAFQPPYSFHSLTETGVRISHEDGFDLVHEGGTFLYVDPETELVYESFAALQEAQAAPDQEPPDQETDTVDFDVEDDGVVGENVGDYFTDDPPDQAGSFGGYDVQRDFDGPYVDLDGMRLRLIDEGNGYSAQHAGHTLTDSGDGLMVFIETSGYQYSVNTLDQGSIWLTHPSGTGTVGLSDDGFTYRYSSGDGSTTYNYPDDNLFHSFTDTGILIERSDGYHLLQDPDGFHYIDPGTGDVYDSYNELIAAQQQDDENGGDEGDDAAELTADTDDVAVTSTNGSSNGNGSSGSAEFIEEPEAVLAPIGVADTLEPSTGAPDSASIGYSNGQAVLHIVHDGSSYDVALTAVDGGYFVNLGGTLTEVHAQGGTYFVVSDGQAYSLAGDPGAGGWPYNNPASGIDASAYAPSMADPPPDPGASLAEASAPELIETTPFEADDDEAIDAATEAMGPSVALAEEPPSFVDAEEPPPLEESLPPTDEVHPDLLNEAMASDPAEVEMDGS